MKAAASTGCQVVSIEREPLEIGFLHVRSPCARTVIMHKTLFCWELRNPPHVSPGKRCRRRARGAPLRGGTRARGEGRGGTERRTSNVQHPTFNVQQNGRRRNGQGTGLMGARAAANVKRPTTSRHAAGGGGGRRARRAAEPEGLAHSYSSQPWPFRPAVSPLAPLPSPFGPFLVTPGWQGAVCGAEPGRARAVGGHVCRYHLSELVPASNN